MTRSTQPNLQEKYQHYAQKHCEGSGSNQNAMLHYKKNLADEIAKSINYPNHPPLFFPLDRLEKAWFILNGMEE